MYVQSVMWKPRTRFPLYFVQYYVILLAKLEIISFNVCNTMDEKQQCGVLASSPMTRNHINNVLPPLTDLHRVPTTPDDPWSPTTTLFIYVYIYIYIYKCPIM